MRIAVLLSMLAGCEPDLCDTQVQVIDMAAFARVPAERDPFVPAEPLRGPCLDGDVRFEDFGGEASVTIDTNVCSFGTVEWPALLAVREGEPVRTRVWHFVQTTSETAEARIVIAAEDRPMHTAMVPLPSPASGLVMDTFAAPFDVPAGTPVRWHVQNHGANTWNFLELSVTRQQTCPGE